jgi:hypothetical protein
MLSDKLKRWLIANRVWEIYALIPLRITNAIIIASF